MARRNYEVENAGTGGETVYILVNGETVKLEIPDDVEDEGHA